MCLCVSGSNTKINLCGHDLAGNWKLVCCDQSRCVWCVWEAARGQERKQKWLQVWTHYSGKDTKRPFRPAGKSSTKDVRNQKVEGGKKMLVSNFYCNKGTHLLTGSLNSRLGGGQFTNQRGAMRGASVVACSWRNIWWEFTEQSTFKLLWLQGKQKMMMLLANMTRSLLVCKFSVTSNLLFMFKIVEYSDVPLWSQRQSL